MLSTEYGLHANAWISYVVLFAKVYHFVADDVEFR